MQACLPPVGRGDGWHSAACSVFADNRGLFSTPIACTFRHTPMFFERNFILNSDDHLPHILAKLATLEFFTEIMFANAWAGETENKCAEMSKAIIRVSKMPYVTSTEIPEDAVERGLEVTRMTERLCEKIMDRAASMRAT